MKEGNLVCDSVTHACYKHEICDLGVMRERLFVGVCTLHLFKRGRTLEAFDACKVCHKLSKTRPQQVHFIRDCMNRDVKN